MTRGKVLFACDACGHEASQWAGRCSACGQWGSVSEARVQHRQVTSAAPPPIGLLDNGSFRESRIGTGISGLDRVLGGGLMPGSVVLLAGAPGIGKSTLLLHLLTNLAAGGHSCLLASGEESRQQVAGRVHRLGADGASIRFTPGRDLADVLDVGRRERPSVLAVDSIQAVRTEFGSPTPGGVSQVRMCTDALVGLAKEHDIAVVMSGHVTKDGELAGPRTLEHAVDVVLSFEGDARSGLRVLAGGKNRFGAEGETAWFEMTPAGLVELDPTAVLLCGEEVAGSAVALPQVGRRAMAVDVQALVGSPDGPARRQVTGLDGRRFQLVAAVLDRTGGFPLARAELFGATAGGLRVDDPACDLAVAAALASAVSGHPAPPGVAFVGEVALTGQVRPAPAMSARLQAALASGCSTLVAAGGTEPVSGVRIQPVRHVLDALTWALPLDQERVRRLPA